MTAGPTSSPAPPAPAAQPQGAMPVNALARSYQPRRVWGATVSIGWNLLLAGLFVGSGAAERLYKHFVPLDPAYHPVPLSWVAPLYFSILFAGYALLNFPIDLWFGYLEERQFGLAKDGIRAWTRDWVIGTLQHGVMFMVGACAIVASQVLTGPWWLGYLAGLLLALFLGTTYLAADLIPIGLFTLENAEAPVVDRLRRASGSDDLPRVILFSHPSLREFSGGIVGLANRQVLMISRSTLEAAGDSLLRFVLLHDLGHRRYHHNLLSALAGWAWVVLGIALSDRLIPARWGYNTAVFGSPLYVAFLAFTLSAWMALGQPVLAYLGRRLEYQADRYYLRGGGNLEEMERALQELSRQNLARTEIMRRRETIFHPLPSITNRLHRAREFVASLRN